ncbi:hypothetical protein BHE74_00023693 [Ensete ventricosum]|nr:hypothetical protein BHE74_00023693 [Ensete ventricosum]
MKATAMEGAAHRGKGCRVSKLRWKRNPEGVGGQEAKCRVLKLGRKRDQVLAQDRYSNRPLLDGTIDLFDTGLFPSRYRPKQPETPAAFVTFFTEGRRHMQPLTSSSNTADEKTAFFSSSEATRRKGGDIVKEATFEILVIEAAPACFGATS